MKYVLVAVGLAALTSACTDNAFTNPSHVAAKVSGVVSGPTGAPIVGLKVAATFIMFGGSVPPQTATTDASGAYSITAPLEATRIFLTIAGTSDYETYKNNVGTTADSHIDVHLVTRATYTLSGVVSETISGALVPVAGVLVDTVSCDAVLGNCDAYTEVTATTDGSGFYSMSGLWAGKDNFVYVTKAGYVDSAPPATTCDGCTHTLTMSGATQLNIQLVHP